MSTLSLISGNTPNTITIFISIIIIISRTWTKPLVYLLLSEPPLFVESKEERRDPRVKKLKTIAKSITSFNRRQSRV